jgi:hypothetical protein
MQAADVAAGHLAMFPLLNKEPHSSMCAASLQNAAAAHPPISAPTPPGLGQSSTLLASSPTCFPMHFASAQGSFCLPSLQSLLSSLSPLQNSALIQDNNHQMPSQQQAASPSKFSDSTKTASNSSREVRASSSNKKGSEEPSDNETQPSKVTDENYGARYEIVLAHETVIYETCRCVKTQLSAFKKQRLHL